VLSAGKVLGLLKASPAASRLSSNTGLHGLLYTDGTFTTLDDPLASTADRSTAAYGINAQGQIVGSYTNATGQRSVR
jgi:hypothetical protein